MTNKQAWLEIAEAYLTPYKERSEWQKNITEVGLCWASDKVSLNSFGRYWFNTYSNDLWFSVRARSYCYWDMKYKRVTIEKADHLRGTFALFMVWAWDDLFGDEK